MLKLDHTNLHGGQVYKFSERYNYALTDIIDFSANINPVQSMIDWNAFEKNAKQHLIHYPAFFSAATEMTPPPKIQGLIAEKFHLTTKEVILCNGITTSIHQIFTSLKPKQTFLFTPIYSEYHKASEVHSEFTTLYPIPLTEWDQNAHPISENACVVLVNPSTPQGELIDSLSLKRLASHCDQKNAWLFIDESFLPFIGFETQLSARQWIEQYPQLIVLQSLTKYYACPGVRIGCIFTSNTSFKQHVHQPWSISSMDQVWLQQALEDRSFDKLTRRWLSNAKPKFIEQLSGLSCTQKVYPSETNFMVVKFFIPIHLIQQQLNLFGIIIRDLSSFGYDPYHARIAIKSASQNQQLINALRSIESIVSSCETKE